MSGYLRRLASTGAAYTAASIISKLIAVALLPLYTRFLTPADYGAAEVMFAAVVAISIVIRLGVIEALLRFYYKTDEDPEQVVATSFASLFWAGTIAAIVLMPFAGPISEAAARHHRRRTCPGRDRRPLGAHPVGVPAHPVPPRRACDRLLHGDHALGAGHDPGHDRAGRGPGARRDRPAAGQLRHRRGRSCSA